MPFLPKLIHSQFNCPIPQNSQYSAHLTILTHVPEDPMMHLYIGLPLACIFLPLTTSLGINCRGSIVCSDTQSRLRPENNLIGSFYSAIHTGNSYFIRGGPISPKYIYHPGEHIACEVSIFGSGGICVFVQGNIPAEGVNGQLIVTRLRELVEHGCNECGSVPLSGDNDPDKMGLLTVNYVSTATCNGVCNYSTSQQ